MYETQWKELAKECVKWANSEGFSNVDREVGRRLSISNDYTESVSMKMTVEMPNERHNRGQVYVKVWNEYDGEDNYDILHNEKSEYMSLVRIQKIWNKYEHELVVELASGCKSDYPQIVINHAAMLTVEELIKYYDRETLREAYEKSYKKKLTG